MSCAFRTLLLACFLGLVATAFGSFSRADGSTLLVNEARVLTLRATVARVAPALRAALAAKRLAAFSPVREITAKTQGRAVLLLAAGKVVLQVDPADADAYQTTPTELAGMWKQSINEALQLPPLTFGTRSVTLGVGHSCLVDVKGRLANVATFANEAPEIVTIKRVPTGLVIRGAAVGSTRISTGNGPVLAVRVLPVAAQFPQTLTAEVAGSPASSEAARAAVLRAVRSKLATIQGATCRIMGKVVAEPVGIGDSAEAVVHVRTAAPEAFSAEGNVVVRVHNIGVEKASEGELWYSNDPERVTRPQDLFFGSLTDAHPVRLLYHHLNDSAQDLTVRVELVNRGDSPARIVVIKGYASPNANPVLAGLDAAEDFLRDWLTGSGQVVSVPPHAKLPLVVCPIDRTETASGLYSLRLLPGGPTKVGVNVSAVLRQMEQTNTQSSQWIAADPTPLPRWQEEPPTATPQVYPRPFCDESVSYEVGRSFGFLRLGEKALSRQTAGTPLYGNFGVVYRMTVSMNNPTAAPADIEVVFESSAGYSGGLFYINGEVVRINPVQPKEEARLLRVRLEPGEKRETKFLTLPLSGSAYPATIIVRPVGG